MSSQVCNRDQNDTRLQIPWYSDAAADPSLFGNLVLDQNNVVEDVLRPGHILHSFHQDLLGHLTQGHKKPHDSAVLQDKPETLADNPVGLWYQKPLTHGSQETSHTGPEMDLLLTPSP